MSKLWLLFLPMMAIAQIRTNLMEETGKANLPSASTVTRRVRYGETCGSIIVLLELSSTGD